MLPGTKAKYYKKLLDLLLNIQGNQGFFFYHGYYCNLEKMDNDYAVYVSYFQKKEYFGLYQNVFQIERKEDFKSLELELLETRNKSLEFSEKQFFDFMKNYGTYKEVDGDPCYEILYDPYNYIRMFVEYHGRPQIVYIKGEGDEAVHGETRFVYGVNMLREVQFVLNTYRAKYYTNRGLL